MDVAIVSILIMIIVILTGNWHPEATKIVYRDFYLQLLESLPMGDVLFLELLKHQNLLPGDLKQQVQARATRMEKAVWFLDNAIEHPLKTDNFEPLCRLLTVMTDELHLKNDSLKQLAAEIEQELDEETSFVKGITKGKKVCMLVLCSYWDCISTCSNFLSMFL